MKCVRGMGSEEVFRCSDRHADTLVMFAKSFEYAPKAEWKRGGRKRSGPQDGATISDHPRNGSPPRHRRGSKRKRR